MPSYSSASLLAVPTRWVPVVVSVPLLYGAVHGYREPRAAFLARAWLRYRGKTACPKLRHVRQTNPDPRISFFFGLSVARARIYHGLLDESLSNLDDTIYMPTEMIIHADRSWPQNGPTFASDLASSFWALYPTFLPMNRGHWHIPIRIGRDKPLQVASGPNQNLHPFRGNQCRTIRVVWHDVAVMDNS